MNNDDIEEDLLTDVRQALRAGHKLEAIKIYREATGVDLATAKSEVERLADDQDGSDEASPDDPFEQIKQALYAGRKIEAIRMYREATKSGLAESKVEVERLEAGLRQADPDKFAATSGGCFGVILMVASVFATGLLSLIISC